jgi:hypothetical protein
MRTIRTGRNILKRTNRAAARLGTDPGLPVRHLHVPAAGTSRSNSTARGHTAASKNQLSVCPRSRLRLAGGVGAAGPSATDMGSGSSSCSALTRAVLNRAPGTSIPIA